MIFTEWKEIKEYELNNFAKYMQKAIVLDGRNCYEINKIPKKMIYEAIGNTYNILKDNGKIKRENVDKLAEKSNR